MREAAKHRKKVIYTEERLSKLRTVSEVRRGKKLTDEHRQKCSASLKGKVTSDETKDKIRLRKIGIKRPLEVIAKMKDTISERYPDGRPNGMTGRRHTESSLTKMRMSKFGASNARRMRPIICINTDEVFSSVKAASEKLNIPSSYISAVLTGIQKSTNGFEFRYVNG